MNRDPINDKHLMKELSPFLKSGKQIAGRIKNLDLRELRTLFQFMEKEINQALEGYIAIWGQEGLLELFRRLLQGPLLNEIEENLREIPKILKQNAAKDPRYSQLMRLIKEAEKNRPLSPFWAFSCMVEDIYVFCLAPIEPIYSIQKVEDSTGEVRARALQEAFKQTCEILYSPYLQVIWKLLYFSQEKIPGDPPSFGSLSDQLYKKLQKEYPDLVHPKAALLRNAAVHHHWEYQSVKDSIIVWDKKKPREEIPIEELIVSLRDMYTISSLTIRNTILLYIMRDIFIGRGMFDFTMKGIRVLVNKDYDQIRSLDEEFNELKSSLFKPSRI